MTRDEPSLRAFPFFLVYDLSNTVLFARQHERYSPVMKPNILRRIYAFILRYIQIATPGTWLAQPFSKGRASCLDRDQRLRSTHR